MAGNPMWRSPTPHETSLAKLDEFLAVHRNRWNMATEVARFGGSINSRALRHLRLTAAIERVRAMRHNPPVILRHG